MIVKQLIVELQKYEMDAEVIIVLFDLSRNSRLIENLHSSQPSLDGLGNKIVYLKGEN